MDPVVYDFAINEHGSVASLLSRRRRAAARGILPAHCPAFAATRGARFSPRANATICSSSPAPARTHPEFTRSHAALLDRMLPSGDSGERGSQQLDELLAENGFDRAQHEQIRADLARRSHRAGDESAAANTRIEDVSDALFDYAEQLFDARASRQQNPARTRSDAFRTAGEAALRRGEVAVVTYAAGVGSRWTQGAGVVKGLHPFAKLGGRHRSFIEVHLAKSASHRASSTARRVPHVFTTSYLTHAAIEKWVCSTRWRMHGRRDRLLSPGKSIGLRLVPMVRDLQFAWEETAQQKLDEQKEKMRESVRAALTQWARTTGEGSDYTDNVPGQCLHPVGHWFEVPNLLKNGTLARLLALAAATADAARPQRRHARRARSIRRSLGWFQASGATLGWEVIPRRIEDHGGGLARVDGRLRMVEGLALPAGRGRIRI